MKKIIAVLLTLLTISQLAGCGYSAEDVKKAEKKGYESGYEQGYKSGNTDGYRTGYSKGCDDVRTTLNKVPSPTQAATSSSTQTVYVASGDYNAGYEDGYADGQADAGSGSYGRYLADIEKAARRARSCIKDDDLSGADMYIDDILFALMSMGY